VRIPDEAAAGKAKITVSFPDWQEGKVAPTTFEMTIEEPPSEADRIKELEAERPSLHGWLSMVDVARFRAGRSKSDILHDLHWRVGSVHGAEVKGRRFMVVDYSLVADVQDVQRGKRVHAVFVDGRFERLVASQSAVTGNPLKMSEYAAWLDRLINTEGFKVGHLRKTTGPGTAPQDAVEIGLTIAWLLRQPMTKNHNASEEEYRWNAALRDQFNAARLDLGMSQQEVEDTLKVRPKIVKGVREYGPLASGKLEAGDCKVYGSTVSFPISREFHYSHVVVIFRQGKAVSIFSFPADTLGRDEAPDGIIDYLQRQESQPGRSAKQPLQKRGFRN
jgi:hypothetical protein